MTFFDQLIINPLFHFLLLLSSRFGDLGLAVIILTILMKLLLSPITYMAHCQEDRLRQVSARIKREVSGLKDLQAQSEALQRIYKQENFNPFKNIVLQLVPLPLLLALIAVFNKIKNISTRTFFLNLIDLSKPNIIIAGLVLIFQIMVILTQPPETKRVGLMVIGLVAVLLFTLPSIFTLYWLVTTLLTLVERKVFHWYEVEFAVKAVGKNNSSLSQDRRDDIELTRKFNP
jgi:YidC/Oxa1 family membrane protein insertase